MMLRFGLQLQFNILLLMFLLLLLALFFVAAGVVDAEALASDVAFVAFVSDVAAFVAAACQLQ